MMKKKKIIPYSLKKTPLQWSWLLLGSFLFFSFGGEVVLGLEKNYIDIKGSLYQRIKIYPKWEGTAIYNTRFVIATLRKNLEWSGVFDIKKTKKRASLKFIMAKKIALADSSKDNVDYGIQDAIVVKIFTQEDKLLLQGSFKNNRNPKELENNAIDFVQNVIYKISRKKGTLGSAIIYSAQKDSLPKKIVITDTHDRYKQTIISNSEYNILPRWTINEKGFIYTASGSIGTRIFFLDLRKKQLKVLISSSEGISTGGSWNKKNGDLIATLSKNGNADIYLFENPISKTGNIKQRFTSFSSIDTSPSLSPDGENLLFVSNRSGTAQIYIMNLKTKKLKRLSFMGTYNVDPKWSNDGNYIIYAGLKNGVFQIFLMNIKGEILRQLTFNKKSSEEPSWSPDDRLIIFSSKISGEAKIYVMTVDGEYARRLTQSTKGIKEINPDWASNFQWRYLK